MSIGWGQGKVEVEKHRQEILDLLAGGWTARRIFLHLQESKNIAVSLRAFYRAVKGLLPAPAGVDDAPHSQTARTRAAKLPRPVALPAPSNSALPSSAGSAPAEVLALPSGDLAAQLPELVPEPAPGQSLSDPSPSPPRAHSSLEVSGFRTRAYRDDEMF